MKTMSDSYLSNTNNSVMREHLISSVPFDIEQCNLKNF